MKGTLRTALFAAPVVLLALHAIDSADIWFHLATGERILSTLRLPTTDPFGAASPPVAWIVHDWLAGVLFALLHRIGGAPALVLAATAAFTVALVLPLARARRAGEATWPYEIAVLLSTAIAAERFFVRPELFTIRIASLWVRALAGGAPRDRRALIWMGVLQVAWTNLHAAFLLGPLLAGVAVAGDFLDRIRRRQNVPLSRWRLALPAVCLLACLVTPYGPRLLLHILAAWRDVGAQELRAGVLEWQATFAQPVPGDFVLMVFVASLAAVVAAFAVGWRNATGFEALAAALLTVLACTSRRHLTLYAVTVLPLAARWVAARWRAVPARTTPRRKQWLRYALSGIPCLVAAFLAVDAVRGTYWARVGPPRTLGLGFSAADHPIGAGEFVARHKLPGPLFNNIAAGSYLIWQLRGDPPVLVDGRLLDPAAFRVYRLCLQSGETFETWASQRGTRTVVLALQPVPPVGLFRALAQSPHWKLVYLDGEGAVFVDESVLAAHPELPIVSLAAPLPPATAPLGPAAGIWHGCDSGEAGRRGLVLGALGFPVAASADLSRALVHCPGNPVVAMTLGKANAGMQRHAAAVPLLESGLQYDPMDLDAWLLLGVSRAALGRDAAAKEAWERAVAVAPNDPRAALLLQRLEEFQRPER